MGAHTFSSVKAGAKFFYHGEEKFRIRGVTYGAFAPREEGDYPAPERVTEDFRMMREAGINTVRIYTAPPRYLLDEAARQGLRVIVGLAWMQHVCFLDDAAIARRIRDTVRREVRACADHPAVLAFAIGNEIPAQIVRWHGRRRIEGFLKQLHDDVKREAPHALVTYVNYPTTDYLDLPFLDFVCFNVFLHRESDFKAYLSKLQNIAGNRPLVLTELGMDSLREGEAAQARFLDWQLREAFGGGVAGVCVFSWTDDWYRGGAQIEDWAFGLVDSARNPKPAYNTVCERFAHTPFELEAQQGWPKVSVVVCAYNAAETLEDCLSSLERLRYPNYEVIVINDGSRDATPEIAERHPVKLISVPNGGLSAARNLGMRAATGEIVAYTDADTRADEDWLAYLVQPFLATNAVGVGGPNVVPHDDGWVAQCVARSPGGPTQVLLDDTTAEHIPGCNMAFRKWALEEVGGFDPTYKKAGDDVDICWRLQARGWRLGFSHSALVWHHHRNSVWAYWRQQVGYGEGESFLAQRHPEKFNQRGQTRWQGRIYSPLPVYRSLFQSVIYHGRWGGAAFPSIYQGGVNSWKCLPLMIEWQLLTALFFLAALLEPWLLAAAVAGVCVTLWHSTAHALETKLDDPGLIRRLRNRAMIAWLHYMQPWARLRGQIKGALGKSHLTSESAALLQTAPWLPPGDALRLLVSRYKATYWDTHYTELDHFIDSLRAAGESSFNIVRSDDGWQQAYDLRIEAGALCSFDVKATAEDHGGMNRLFRVEFRLLPPWFMMMALLASAAIIGHSLNINFINWLVSVLLLLGAAAAVFLAQASRRGGQLLAVTDAVGDRMKLMACNSVARTGEEEVEHAFEKQ